MKGERQGFPTTRRTALERTRSADEEMRRQAYETLVTCYWKPVYKYLRLRWGLPEEDARDATQEFFLQAMQKEFFQDYDPSRARFRTYLRLRLDTMILKQRRSAGRLKRGGEYQIVPVDFDRAEAELAVPVHTPASSVEEYFRSEWLRGIVELSVAALRTRYQSPGRQVQFTVFERYELEAPEGEEKPRYEDLARELGLTVTQVTNYLSSVRKAFKECVVQKLREATGSEAELQAEARELFPGSAPLFRTPTPLSPPPDARAGKRAR